MYRTLKPCIRCEGTGKIQVLDLSRPEVLFGEEWPMRDATCHGCGGTGKVPDVGRGEPALTPDPGFFPGKGVRG
jgi:hypothetical protein